MFVMLTLLCQHTSDFSESAKLPVNKTQPITTLPTKMRRSTDLFCDRLSHDPIPQCEGVICISSAINLSTYTQLASKSRRLP